MSLGSVSNDYKQNIWGAAAYSQQQAASLGSAGKTADFKNALEETENEEDNLKTFGFGATGEDGGRSGSSISAMLGLADDMLSQLQFNFLKNNSAATGNSVKSNMSAIGLGM